MRKNESAKSLGVSRALDKFGVPVAGGPGPAGLSKEQ
jgi:hypothetical protein